MGLHLVPNLTLSKSYIVEKLRELPAQGDILVQEGDYVLEQDIVAKAALPGELVLCRLTEALGVEPSEVIAGLTVREGDDVTEGQLLCECQSLFGIFKSSFFAPASGTVELITERTGHVALRRPPNEIVLDAYIAGDVVAVEEGKSLSIRSHCAFVQGVFGVGGERTGSLCLLSCADDTTPTEDDLPHDCSGKVLVGGTAPTGHVLKEAEARGAHGWVLGALDDTALREYLGYDIGLAFTGSESVGMTVLITEGFGRVPLAARVREVVSGLDGSSCSLNGATQVRAGAVRPELIVPYPEEKKKRASSEDSLGEGATVRLIREPYFGVVGEVVRLPVHPEQLPTGAYSRVAYVALSTGEIVSVPRANIELYL